MESTRSCFYGSRIRRNRRQSGRRFSRFFIRVGSNGRRQRAGSWKRRGENEHPSTCEILIYNISIIKQMEMNPNNRLKTCSLPPLLPPIQHEMNFESSESMSPYGTTISKSFFNRNNRTAPLNEDTSINTIQRMSDRLPPLK